MKNRKKIIGMLGGILVVAVFMGSVIFANNNDKMANWGSFLSQNHAKEKLNSSDKKGEADIYEEGTSAVVTVNEIEQATRFYELSGVDPTTAKNQAVDYMKQREALYQEAIANGYTVTDEEVRQYINQLKDTVKTAQNSDAVKKVISQFPSEDAYWDYEFTVYKKDLPIQKYVANMEANYGKSSDTSATTNNLKSSSTDSVSNSGWDAYYKQYKDKLVEKQNYHKK